VERFSDFRDDARFFFDGRVERTRAGIASEEGDPASTISTELLLTVPKASIDLAALAITSSAIEAHSFG
jgi:hypothetical protein